MRRLAESGRAQQVSARTLVGAGGYRRLARVRAVGPGIQSDRGRCALIWAHRLGRRRPGERPTFLHRHGARPTSVVRAVTDPPAILFAMPARYECALREEGPARMRNEPDRYDGTRTARPECCIGWPDKTHGSSADTPSRARSTGVGDGDQVVGDTRRHETPPPSSRADEDVLLNPQAAPPCESYRRGFVRVNMIGRWRARGIPQSRRGSSALRSAPTRGPAGASSASIRWRRRQG